MPVTFSPPPRISDSDMHHGTCVTHVPWCMSGSLTSGFLWSQWRGKRSQHSRRMRNRQFYVSGKRPIVCLIMTNIPLERHLIVCIVMYLCHWHLNECNLCSWITTSYPPMINTHINHTSRRTYLFISVFKWIIRIILLNCTCTSYSTDIPIYRIQTV